MSHQFLLYPPSKETMIKIANEPGLCNKSDIIEFNKWLMQFNIELKAYKEVFGDPVGSSVNSLLDKLKYYVERA